MSDGTGEGGAQQPQQTGEPGKSAGAGVLNPQPPNQPAPADDFTAFGELTPEQKTTVAAKGWKTPADGVDSYVALEKLHGLGPERLVALPKDAEDTEGWNKVFERLGRPADASGYDLKIDGLDEAQGKAFAEKAHALGLTSAQVKALAAWDVERGAAAAQAQQEQFIAEGQEAVAALKTEWGQAYGQREQQARAAAQEFGIKPGILDENDLTSIEKAIGTAKLLKLFESVGARMGEAPVVEGQAQPGGGFGPMTPATASAKIAELTSDPQFMAAYMATGMGRNDPRHLEAVKKMAALHEAKNPTS